MRPSATDSSSVAIPDPVHPNPFWSGCRVLLRLFFVMWLGYRARGSEKLPVEGGALLLANHQSHLDPLLIGLPLSRPVSYLARQSLLTIPLLGYVMRRNYVIALNRERAGASSFREAIRWLQRGFLLGVFPEGTRTRDGTVGRMKPGFVALVRRSGVPVFPVGIAGAHEAMPRGSRLIYPSRVRVVFGDPLTDEELNCYTRRGQEGAFVAAVQEKIVACQREAERWRRRSVAPGAQSSPNDTRAD